MPVFRRLIETHRDGLTGAAAPVIFFAGVSQRRARVQAPGCCPDLWCCCGDEQSGAYFFWQAGVASELLKRHDVDR